MRHWDRRLSDKIYPDENLFGTSAAFDTLPNYGEKASQIASQILGAKGQFVSSPVAASAGAKVDKTIAMIGGSQGLVLPGMTGLEVKNGGSGGARTRNLYRDRAAL